MAVSYHLQEDASWWMHLTLHTYDVPPHRVDNISFEDDAIAADDNSWSVFLVVAVVFALFAALATNHPNCKRRFQ